MKCLRGKRAWRQRNRYCALDQKKQALYVAHTGSPRSVCVLAQRSPLWAAWRHGSRSAIVAVQLALGARYFPTHVACEAGVDTVVPLQTFDFP